MDARTAARGATRASLGVGRTVLGALALRAVWAAGPCSAFGLAEHAEVSSSELQDALHADEECRPGADPDEACGVIALQLRGRAMARGTGASGKFVSWQGDREGNSMWTRERRCSGNESHEVLFVLKPKDADKVVATALALSEPGSPSYRKWLSASEARELTRNSDGLKALKASLAGVAEPDSVQESAGGLLLRARASVDAWERYLSAEFHQYRSQAPAPAASFVLRSPAGYTVPSSVQSHVHGLMRVAELPEHQPQPGPPAALAAKAVGEVTHAARSAEAAFNESFPTYAALKARFPSVISPKVLRQAYNVPAIAPRGSAAAEEELAQTSQMVYAMLDQHWSPSDRTIFEAQLGIPQDNYVRQLNLEHGESMVSDATCRGDPRKCYEANLDVQYMMAMSPWSRMSYWYSTGRGAPSFSSFLDDFAEQFAESSVNPPQVISISYALPEFFVSDAILELFDVAAIRLALQGVTIVAASGDDGAASRLAAAGCERLMARYGLQVVWPASSSWVTAVGATIGAGTGSPEVACSVNATGPAAEATADLPPQITSGGGFSRKVARPPWQPAYDDGVPGRGVPDVALQGHAFPYVNGGKWRTIDGTSASAPAFAGMVSNLNARLIADGQPSVGFLNPLLYGTATSAFTDIVSGDNKCAELGMPCCGGFEAREGWDPVTGLGTPDVAKLLKLIQASAPPPSAEVFPAGSL